jgi:SPP1 gp7 family putative phage head morphogenesis protein
MHSAQNALREPKNKESFRSGYLSPEVEWKHLAAKQYRPETAVHAAADKNVKKMRAAIRYAFMRGRQALGHAGRPNVDGAANTVKLELIHLLRQPLLDTLRDGGNAALKMLPRPKAAEELRDLTKPFDMAFDVSDPRAVQWAHDHAAELAEGISETTRQAIRDAIEEAVAGDGIDAAYDTIEEAVGDADRAEMIARTETMTAANEGQREGWDQAVEEGLLTGDEKREWIATGDEGVCDECDALDGEVTDLDGQYPGDGGDGPPLHPNCRCTEGIVELRDAEFDPGEDRDDHGQWTAGGSFSDGSQVVVGQTSYTRGSGGWSSGSGSHSHEDVTSALIDSGGGGSLTAKQKKAVSDAFSSVAKKNKSKLPMMFFAAGAAADLSTTFWSFQHGGTEQNPLVSWIHSPAKMVAFAAGMDVLGAWGWVKLTENHEKIQEVGFIIFGILSGIQAIMNARATLARKEWEKNNPNPPKTVVHKGNQYCVMTEKYSFGCYDTEDEATRVAGLDISVSVKKLKSA